MKARFRMEVDFPDEKSARAAEKALSHEGGVGSRSEMRIKSKGGTLLLEIDSDDVVALRASANACLRALQAFESMK